MEELKEKIKRIRISKKLSQSEVAECAGITRVAYSYFENGRTDKLSLDAAIGIAKALEVSFNDLFEIEEGGKEIDKLKSEIKALTLKLQDLTDHKKLVEDVYSSSFEINSIGTLELEKLKDVFTLIDIFQFVDINKFSIDYPYLIKTDAVKHFLSLDVIIKFYNLDKENSKGNLVDYIDFIALEKSPDLLKSLGLGLNSKKWDKLKIVKDLKEYRKFQ
ncbi:hypothetical protein MASR2M12_20780 [Bacteroidales bacterium]